MVLNIEYFREVLERNRWSGRQFAMKSGLSCATISRVLTGKRNPSKKTTEKIARALKDEPKKKLFLKL